MIFWQGVTSIRTWFSAVILLTANLCWNGKGLTSNSSDPSVGIICILFPIAVKPVSGWTHGRDCQFIIVKSFVGDAAGEPFKIDHGVVKFKFAVF